MKFPTNFHPRETEKGSILIFSLWVLLIMGFFSLSVGYAVRQKIRAMQNLEQRQELRYMAEAGVKKAVYILNSSKDENATGADALNHVWSTHPGEFSAVAVGEGGYSVAKYAFGRGDARYADDELLKYGLIDEESKLNINSAETPEELARLFQAIAGVTEDEASLLADSIVDWKDEDDHPYAGGAESRFYGMRSPPHGSKNAKFDALEELLFVKGVTPEIYAKITPYITAYSSGKININTAPGPVLQALNLNAVTVKKILSYRSGPDQKSGTSDDGIFDDAENIVTVLDQFAYLDDAEKNKIRDFTASAKIGVSSEYFWIQSVGKLKRSDRRLIIQCIVKRFGEIVHWREYYV